MYNVDNNDIEQLARHYLSNDQQQPPQEVWQSIEKGLRHQSTSQQSRRRALRWCIIGGVAVAVLASVMWATARPTPTVEQVTLATSEPNTTVQTIVLYNASDNAPSVSKSNPTKTTVAETDQQTAPNNTIVYTSIDNQGLDDAVVVSDDAPQVNHSQSQEHIEELPTTITELTTNTQTSIIDETPTNHENNTPANDQSQEVQQRIKTMVIPNLITPNGDGYNDCWAIGDLAELGVVQVQIFNRNSRRVYSNSHYANNFCGDGVEDGDYFYVLHFVKAGVTRRGVLVIKR